MNKDELTTRDVLLCHWVSLWDGEPRLSQNFLDFLFWTLFYFLDVLFIFYFLTFEQNRYIKSIKLLQFHKADLNTEQTKEKIISFDPTLGEFYATSCLYHMFTQTT